VKRLIHWLFGHDRVPMHVERFEHIATYTTNNPPPVSMGLPRPHGTIAQKLYRVSGEDLLVCVRCGDSVYGAPPLEPGGFSINWSFQ
jgi:hypothetical protein